MRDFGALILLLVGVLAALFWGVIQPGHTLFSNDGPLGAHMMNSHKLPEILTGSWEDLNTLGSRSGGALPNITYGLLYALGPVNFSKFYAPLALLILGLGAWCFFRRLGFAPIACWLGAVAAALNSAFLSAAAWGVAAHAITIGMSFLALAALVDPAPRRRWLSVPLAGLAVGMAVMEGADIGAIFSILVAIFAVYQTWIAEGKKGRNLVIGCIRVALIAGFAVFMAFHAVKVLVATQIQGVAGVQQDTRSKEQRWDYATQWSLPKKEALGLIVPGLFGYRMDTPGGGSYWGGGGRDPAIDRWMDSGRHGEQPAGFMRFSGGGNYAGVLVALVAIWAVFQGFRKQDSVFALASRRWIWFWSAVLLASLLLAFGRFAPFYQILYMLPYFSTIRNPAKFIHIFSWALVILFAYGIQGIWLHYLAQPVASKGPLESFSAWFKRVSGFDRRWAMGMLALVGVAALAWLMFSSSRRQFETYLTGVQFDPATAAEIAGFSFGQVGWFLVFLAAAVALLLMVFSGRFRGSRAKWGALLLGAFLVVDLGRANQPWIIVWDYQQKYATNPVIERLRDKAYEQRVAILPGWMHQMLRTPSELTMLDQLYRIEWAQHHFYYYNIQSLDIVQMPRMPEDLLAFETAFQPKSMADLPRLLTRHWQLTSTRYLLGPADHVAFLNQQIDPAQQRFRIAERFNVVPKPGISQPTKLEELTAALATNGAYALIEFTGALPRAGLYHQWQVNTNEQAVLSQLTSPEFNPATNVMVSSAAVPAPAVGGANSSTGTVEFTSYSPKHSVLKASAAAPAVLLVNDRYDPNWTVSVDGKPEAVLKANYLMRGVFLPPGQHTVEFRFEPPHGSLYVSLAACAVALVLLALLLFVRDDATTDPEGAAGKITPGQ